MAKCFFTFLDVSRRHAVFEGCFLEIIYFKNIKIRFSHFDSFLEVLRLSKYTFWKVRITENMAKYVFKRFWTFLEPCSILNTIFGKCVLRKIWKNICSFLHVSRRPVAFWIPFLENAYHRKYDKFSFYISECPTAFWRLFLKFVMPKTWKCVFSHFKTFLDVLRRSKYHFWQVRIIENMEKCLFTFLDVSRRQTAF